MKGFLFILLFLTNSFVFCAPKKEESKNKKTPKVVYDGSFFPNYKNGSFVFDVKAPRFIFDNGFVFAPAFAFGFNTAYFANLYFPQLLVYSTSLDFSYKFNLFSVGYRYMTAKTLYVSAERAGFLSYLYDDGILTSLLSVQYGENYLNSEDLRLFYKSKTNLVLNYKVSYRYFSNYIVNLSIKNALSYSLNFDDGGGQALGFYFSTPIDLFQKSLSITPFLEYGRGWGSLNDYNLDLSRSMFLKILKGKNNIFNVGMKIQPRYYFLRNKDNFFSGLYLSGYLGGSVSFGKKNYKRALHGVAGGGMGVSLGKGVSVEYNILYSSDVGWSFAGGIILSSGRY